MLQNDVLAHQSTVEAVKKAGNDLIESSAIEEASNLRSKLELLNQRWQNVLEKTEQRKEQLQSALIQVNRKLLNKEITPESVFSQIHALEVVLNQNCYTDTPEFGESLNLCLPQVATAFCIAESRLQLLA